MASFHAAEHVCCGAEVSEIGAVGTSGCDGKGGEEKKGTQAGVLGAASICTECVGWREGELGWRRRKEFQGSPGDAADCLHRNSVRGRADKPATHAVLWERRWGDVIFILLDFPYERSGIVSALFGIIHSRYTKPTP